MADPITAGVVASSLMPAAGAATAASIPTLAGAGALVGGMGGAAAAPSITGALTNGLATGSSLPALFGQGGMLSQANQGLSVFNQANQAFGGGDQQMQMAPVGQIQRSQIQPIDYMSLLNPQNQSVIRTPQISLLG
jgi:hypothetical protein